MKSAIVSATIAALALSSGADAFMKKGRPGPIFAPVGGSATSSVAVGGGGGGGLFGLGGGGGGGAGEWSVPLGRAHSSWARCGARQGCDPFFHGRSGEVFSNFTHTQTSANANQHARLLGWLGRLASPSPFLSPSHSFQLRRRPRTSSDDNRDLFRPELKKKR